MIEPSLKQRLMEVLKHERIYPETIPIHPEEDLIDTDLPAVAYQLVSEAPEHECINGRPKDWISDYLIEVFTSNPDQGFAEREKLRGGFRGPPNPEEPNRATGRWRADGPVITEARFLDPSTGREFAISEAHNLAHFTRCIIRICWSE